jgi:hypothetical protein
MNLKRLHSILEQESHQGCKSKSALLDSLYEFFKGERIDEPQVARIIATLEMREQLPVEFSRFDLQDLPRRISLISWKRKAAVVRGVESIIEECTTVSGGDCDECMGEELVYMWDLQRDRLVRRCLLCTDTLDLVGAKVMESVELTEATESQLRAAEIVV